MTRQIRVFVIDDYDLVISGLQRIIESTPEKDMVFVGSATNNTAATIEQIHRSNADLVITDIALGQGLTLKDILKKQDQSGPGAINRIRDNFRERIKIIAVSHWLEAREQAIKAGADTFLLKGASNDEIRNAIRQIYYSTENVHIADHTIDCVAGMTLYLRSRKVRLDDEFKETDYMEFSPVPFAFLHYLALERQCGATNWISRESKNGSVIYEIMQKEEWNRVCSAAGNVWGNTFSLDRDVLPRWANMINNKVRIYVREPECKLIQVPGGGRRRKATPYALIASVTGERVRIQN